MPLSLGFYTDGGPFRANNQDALCLRTAPTAWGTVAMIAVCDGMGGLEDGEFASAAAVQRLSGWFDGYIANLTPEALRHEVVAAQWSELLQQLHGQIRDYSEPKGNRTGTTVSVMLLYCGQYTIAHIGDTRIYLTDTAHTGLVTQDQNLAMREMQEGRLSPADYATDSRRSVLLQCLGTGAVEPVFLSGALPTTGGVLICSDGFYGKQNLPAIHSCMSLPHGPGFDTMLQHLGNGARNLGEQDNLTAAAIRWTCVQDWNPVPGSAQTLVIPDASVLDTAAMLASVQMPEDSDGDTVRLSAVPDDTNATVVLPEVSQPVPATELLPENVEESPMDATAPLGQTAPLAETMDATAPLGETAPMAATAPVPPAPVQTGNGNGLIPDEICGNDLINIRPLGASGGFSNLFLGHKRELDVDVVIKRVKKNLQGMLNEQSEAKIMTALRHQYLPRVYDLKTASDGFTYTIMEYIEGCTLKDYVVSHGKLDQRQVLKWTCQLCEVANYMHTGAPKSIIHSDLKPENVMITPQGNICVIDFNASLEADGAAEAIGATAGFAAPEQYNLPLKRFPKTHPLYRQVKAAQGMGKVSFRTDIYAIGALAYYMLTGYVPKPWNEGVLPLERYDIVLGDAFREVIQRAMAPKQADRYRTAADMLKMLNNMNRIDKRYRRWVGQCRFAAIVVSLGLMASIFCLFVGWTQLQNDGKNEYLKIVMQAQTLRQQGDIDGCRELLLQAVSMDDNRIEAYLELASLMYQLGEYQQALDLLELEEFDQSADMENEAFVNSQGQLAYIKGSCFFQLQKYTDALQSYQLAVNYCPGESLFLRELAIAYAKTGNPSSAQQTLSQMEQAGAPAVDVELVNGEIRFAYGEYIQAYQHLTQAAKLTQDVVLKNRCYTMAAQCCQQAEGSQWLDTEISMLQGACAELGTENATVLQLLSEAWLRKGSVPGADTQACYNEAMNCLQQLLDRGSKLFQVRLNAAVVLQYLNRFEEALQILTALENDFPRDYRIPMNMAILEMELQSTLDVDDRNYAAFGAAYGKAQSLYATSGTQDAAMVQLEQLADQLKNAGWTW